MNTMPRIRPLLLTTVVALIMLVLSGCGTSEQPAGNGFPRAGDNDGFAGTPVDAFSLPAVTLTDTSGRPFDLRADTNAPVTLVFFGYTHCPDQCPLTTATITTALRQLEPAAREQVEVLFITADPERDTPPVMRRWLDRFDPRYTGLTGPKATIEKVADTLGVALTGKSAPVAASSGGYDVGHAPHIYAFGPDDRSILVWTGSPSISAISGDLARIL
jgi:protein SCO1/2